MGTTPTHEQGQLHLQVYDLRREARLRQARDWFFRNYIAETIEDSRRIAPPGSENGALVMQVLSYWEHACALLNYGLLHEESFLRDQWRVLRSLGAGQAGHWADSQGVLESVVPRAPRKGRGALRIVERKPHSRSYRCYAANDEAGAESTHGDGESLS